MTFLSSFYKAHYLRMIQLIGESFNPNDFIEQEEDVKDTFIEWELAHHFEQWEKMALNDILKDPVLKKQVLLYSSKNRSLTERFRLIKEELRHYHLLS
jgi:hypothetical protein